MNQLVAFALLLLTSTSFAQTNYNPQFLIPYNNNGNWGWCDTLGNIKIKGDFKEVHFFYQRYQHPNEFEAYIDTKAGENRYDYQKGLLVPMKYGIVKDLYQEPTSKNRWVIIQDASKKFGLYDGHNQKLIVDTKWENYYYEDEWKTEIYFSRNSEKTFWGYNFKTQKLYKTQIDSVFEIQIVSEVNGMSFVSFEQIFHQTNGRYTRFVDGTQVEMKKEEVMSLANKDTHYGFSAGPDYDDNPFSDGNGKSTPSKADSKTGIIREIDYSRYENSPFKKLIVKSENNKVGVVTEKGDTLLPFIYDQIITKNSNLEFYTYQNGKIGLKLLYTIYPVIEPKYERLERSHQQLRVNDHWSFQFYEVKINGKTGLIGENGVEYFYFD